MHAHITPFGKSTSRRIYSQCCRAIYPVPIEQVPFRRQNGTTGPGVGAVQQPCSGPGAWTRRDAAPLQ